MQRLSRLHIPKNCGLVVRPRQYSLAVLAESHTGNWEDVSLQSLQPFCSESVPNFRHSIVVTGDDRRAVWRNSNATRKETARRPLKSSEFSPGARFPDGR